MKTMQNYNYNTDVQLWANARAHFKGQALHVKDGHIIHFTEGTLARFNDNDSAVACLEQAGYANRGENKAFGSIEFTV